MLSRYFLKRKPVIKEIKSPVLSNMKAAGLLSVILPLLDKALPGTKASIKQKRVVPNVVLSLHPAPILNESVLSFISINLSACLQTAQLFENSPQRRLHVLIA